MKLTSALKYDVNCNRTLIIILSVISCIFLAASITFGSLFFVKSAELAALRTEKSKPFCTTLNCVETAGAMISLMNFSADPCDDFFEFACGNYIKEHQSSKTFRIMDGIAKKNKRMIERILFRDETLVEFNSFIQQSSIHAEVLDKATVFYESCLNFHVLVPEDPGLMRPTNSYSFNPNETQVLEIELFAKSSAWVAFPTVSSSLQIEIVNPPSSSDFNTSVSHKVEILDKAHGLMVDYYDTEDLEDVRDSIDLLMTALESALNMDRSDEPLVVSYNQLSNIYPHVMNWRSLARALRLEAHVSSLRVSIQNPSLMTSLNLALSQASPEARYWFAASLNELQKAQNTYSRHFVVDPMLGGGPLEEYCFRETTKVFQLVIAKWLTVAYKNEYERGFDFSRNLYEKLKTSFKVRVENNAELDADSKAKVLEKLEDIEVIYGYFKEFHNEAFVDAFYDSLQISSDFNSVQDDLKAWNNIKKFSILPHVKDFRTYLLIINSDDDMLYPNAFYQPNTNRIFIQTSIISPPFYSSEFPEAMNVGAIGFVLGHELMHPFDAFRVNFDKDLLANSVLTESDWIEYKEDLKCFAEHVSSYNVSGIQLDGNKTITETSADIGGLSVVLDAFEKRNKSNEELPGLTGYSDKKLFYLALTQGWCGKLSDQQVQTDVLTDVHTVVPARINALLALSKDFPETFQCGANSKMNKPTKCSFWKRSRYAK